MAMNGSDLGDRIAAIITSSDASDDVKNSIKALWEKIGKEIVKEVKNAEITIPSGSVITSVSGGSGAPAVGVPNPAPISTNIDAMAV